MSNITCGLKYFSSLSIRNMYQTCYKKSYLEYLGEQKLLLCPFSNLNYINKLLKLKIKGGELFKKIVTGTEKIMTLENYNQWANCL